MRDRRRNRAGTGTIIELLSRRLENPRGNHPVPSIAWPLLLLTGLSVSIGWGVRGQFGHEYGAALAGALGGMTVALLGGRQDWLPRIPYFAFLGAVGFAFGGAMSYMKTVAYIHSSDSATVLYGFACLFLLGGLWAAPAGAGLGLAACLDREQLTRLFIPRLRDLSGLALFGHVPRPVPQRCRWFATSGTTVLTGMIALAVVALMVLIRRAQLGRWRLSDCLYGRRLLDRTPPARSRCCAWI